MVNALIWSVTLYGAEMWTMRKEGVKAIDAFEMWIWRSIEKVGEKRSLMDIIRTQGRRTHRTRIKHILRGNSLQR